MFLAYFTSFHYQVLISYSTVAIMRELDPTSGIPSSHSAESLQKVSIKTQQPKVHNIIAVNARLYLGFQLTSTWSKYLNMH